ncbi:MAG: efflux RND transporter permease subunit, partial [Pseudomonadales bacterium]|nr:efflux RND transporter permease subunit [Pseudomonadales bacterium]
MAERHPLIEHFATHRVAANLLMIMMVLAGLWAARHVTMQVDPDADWPEIWIDVAWPGASAEDIEGRITVPVEQAMNGLAGMDELHSRTQPGRTSIWIEFHPDTDMGVALDRVKQQLASVRNLPLDAEPPVVQLAQDNELIASVLVTADDDIATLIPLVHDFRRDLLSRGIERVEIEGLPEQELAIMVDTRTLLETGTSLDDLAVAIRRSSADVPAGAVGRAQGERTLRSLDQARSVRAFEELRLRVGDALVPLRSLARIEIRPEADQIEVRHAGRPAIELRLMRAKTGDVVESGRIMRRWLSDVRGTLPPGVELLVMKEVWQLLSEQLDVITRNALSGLALVVLVLLAFLSGRVAAWVTLGIPVSFLLALALYWAVFDGTVNILALIAFVMAIGIVVDDAIIVSEDAVAQHALGLSPREAALAGARRMFKPVVTASLTTLAAFAPLLLFGGPMGQIILTLPTVLLCIILASLVECFLVLPNHLATSLGRAPSRAPGRLRRSLDEGFEWLRRDVFTPVLKRALDLPGATVCAAVAATLVAIALVASQRVGVNMVAGLDLVSIQASVRFAPTAAAAEREAFVMLLEETLTQTRAALGEENILGWYSRHHFAEIDNRRQTGPEFAAVSAEFAGDRVRTVTPEAFADAWRSRIETPPSVEVLDLRVAGGLNGGRADLTLRLRGSEVGTLKLAAEALAAELWRYEGVTSVTDDLPWGREQLVFALTDSGRATGLTAQDLGAQLRSAYTGSRVQIFNRRDDELEVRVMLPDVERDDLASLKRFPIVLPEGAMTPLGAVAALNARRGIDEIRHADGELAVRVNAWVDPARANARQILGEIRSNALPGIERRFGVSSELSGKSEEDAMFLNTFASGAVLTLVFIYLILAWVFASWLWPLAIMTAIPFGLTGAIGGHWLMGIDFGIMSILAFFALTGVVVNDSIVLMSFVRRHVDAGMPLRDALEAAAPARLRAVLMTSVTTVAGLAPLM